jgi:DNA-binding XRE family transcriptional regulator
MTLDNGSRRRREIRRITRPLSEADREKYRKLREQLDLEKDEIISMGRRAKRQREAALAELREAFQLLKAARHEQGLGLADMRDRSGIGRSALSRLENDLDPNPTIATLSRYAQALGKRIVVTLVDDEPAE